jgi:hypothetical protein
MNTVELVQYSLGTALDILGQVCSDLTQEQADWMPPGCANPIGSMYWHTMSGADDVVYRWVLGREPLRQRAGWDERVLAVAVPEPQQGGPEAGAAYHAYMCALRVRLPALREYAQAVAADLQGWLATLNPADLDRTVETPIGPYPVAQVLELFVIWHINAHCGEISALKGCLGCKGYPF